MKTTFKKKNRKIKIQIDIMRIIRIELHQFAANTAVTCVSHLAYYN